MNKIMHPIESEELMAYLDGELTVERAAATASHVQECAECHAVVEGFRNVSQTLDAWRVGKAAVELPPEIAAALKEPRDTKRSDSQRGWQRVWRRQPVLAYAGLLAAVFIIVTGTVRLIGGNANRVFSQVAQQVDDNGQPYDLYRSVPSATPRSGSAGSSGTTAPSSQSRPSDRLEQFAKLQQAPQATGIRGVTQDESPGQNTANPAGPMIIRTAELQLIPKDFERTSVRLEEIMKVHRGYIGELKVGGGNGSGRWLTATLRIPSDQLDVTLAELKTLGRVESESQGGRDVTSQYVDLQARLANARNTEKRLTDLLGQRTGKLSDVLEVEREVDRVRGEIERMETERKNTATQVSFATVNLSVAEEYKAKLEAVPASTATRLGNAAVEGYRSMVDGMVGVMLFALSYGPSLVLWGVVMFLPARFVWRATRRKMAQ